MSRSECPSPDTDRRGGFTLLEVLIAMTVLSVGIVGAMEAFGMSVRATARAGRVSGATDLAKGLVTEAVITPSQKLQSGGGKQGIYAWKLQISPLPSGLVRASAEVQWRGLGRVQTITMSQVFLPRVEEKSEPPE